MTQSQSTVKLGLMPPLTGLAGIYGTEISRAGRIACDEINEAGGVLGKPLELIIEDDGSLPESAVAAAEKLVSHHQCSAIIGSLLSNSRIAVAYRVAEPRKIPFLNFSFYEGSIFSRYFFHFAALPNQQIDHMIPYMREKFGPRMFFAGNNYEWPRGSIDAAKRTLLKCDGTIAGEEYTSIGVSTDEIDRLLDRVTEARPDVFVPYFAGEDQVNLLTRFTERGLKSSMAVVMGHYDEVMASMLPESVREGFYSSNTYFMTVDTPENHRYLSRLGKTEGVTGIWPHGNGILTNFGEGAYLCVKAFAQAANKAGTLDPEAMIDALKNIHISSPQGMVHMDPATQHATVNSFLTRCNAAGEFEIIREFGATPPQMPERYSHQRIDHRANVEDDIRLQSRMLDQMTDAVMLIDTRTDSIIYANRGACRMFGYDADEMRNMPSSRLNSSLHRDSGISTSEISDNIAQTGSWQGETRNIHKNGSTLWCRTTVSPFTHPVYGEVQMNVLQDITTLKQSEERLLQSEARFASLFESNPIPCAIRRIRDDQIIAWNPAFEILTGYSHAELNGKHVHQLPFYAKPEQRIPIQEKAKEKIPVIAEEVELNTRDGVTRHVQLTIEYIVLDGEECALGSFADITDRKLSENRLKNFNLELEARISERTKALQDATTMLQTVLDTAPFRIFWKDSNLNFLGCNQLFAHDAGVSSPELLTGKSDYDMPWHANADLYRADDRLVIESGKERLSYEEPMDLADGKHIWLSTTKVPLRNTEGEIIGVLGTYFDVTSRKLAEDILLKTAEQLQAAQKLARMSQFSMDVAKQTLEWSEMAYELLGYPVGAVNPSIAAFLAPIHPEDLPHVQSTVMEAVTRNYLPHSCVSIRLPDMEYRVQHPDGTLLWLRSEGMADLDESGNVARISGMVQDITRHKNAESELIRARDIAENANRAKNHFLSRMSHELRTPMNAILGFSQVLEMNGLAPDQLNFVHEIHRAGEHLLELINELLDLSRIESGRAAILIQAVNLAESISQATSIIQPLVRQHQIRLLNQCDLQVKVLADSFRLRQILVNLLSNAVKYNRPAGVIALNCEQLSENRICLHIRDTGPGIPEDKINLLFHPFERLGAENSNVEGTGIGLALSKQLAELMGMEIQASSVMGQGSTFSVVMSLAGTELSGSAPDSTQPEVAENQQVKSILYIEDNAANLRFIEAVMQNRPGFRLLTATNGEFGIELAGTYKPDIILLDIHLPGMSGYEVLAKIRDNPEISNIPVIALSADAMPLDIEKGMRAGFNEYLTKPVKIELLLDTLAKYQKL